ncbi:RDD family protein [Streptomyces luteolifulvus]|uniref:RDD family protein n=1 Tax=Streptomyces luteolifulvus TaxID=2615112 RepID=A0A6H9USI6_9ACTN|nr:RDD family protein [Streptomyces luteolifulvus]KAB1141831.1 RDD family protein [Streptomyces luteolifulvus]
MSAPTPAPGDDRPREGYYPDPSIPGYVRYWNGAAWVPGTSRPAPTGGEPLAPPSAAAPAPAPVEATGPHFFDEDPAGAPSAADAQHGSRPEAASAWGADRAQQSGFGGDHDRRVSWGAPQDADPRRPDGNSARTDGTATVPPTETPATDSAGTFVFRRPAAGPGQTEAASGTDASDDGTMVFRPAAPRTGQQYGAPGAQAGGASTAGPSAQAGGSGGAEVPAADPAAEAGGGSAAAGRPDAPGFGAGKAASARAAAAQTAAGGAAAQASPAAPTALSGPQQTPASPAAFSGPQPTPPSPAAPAPQTTAPAVPAQPGAPQPEAAAATPVTSGPGGGQSSWAQQVHQLAGGDEQPVTPWKPPVEDIFQAAARRQAAARPAGLGKRLAARLIDTFVLAGVTAVAAVPLGTRAVDHINEKIDAAKLSGQTVTVWLLDGTTSAYLGIVLAVLLVFGVLYEALPHAKWGRTLGKKLLGLEVRDIEAHEPPTFGAALRRWLVYSVPGLLGVGVVGVVWCLFDRPWHQCWHDKAAHTFVAG